MPVCLAFSSQILKRLFSYSISKCQNTPKECESRLKGKRSVRFTLSFHGHVVVYRQFAFFDVFYH